MRKWFTSRKPREQMMVGAFVLTGAVVGFTSAQGHLRAQMDDLRAKRSTLAEQQVWLERSAEIQRRSAEAGARLDPQRTYDATRLVAVLSTMAGAHGLSPVVDSPQTERSRQFACHTVRVSFNQAGLPALLGFYEALVAHAPYLSLESAALQGERSKPGLVNVTLVIAAPQAER